jgi:phosphatidylglycerophosphate synthase
MMSAAQNVVIPASKWGKAKTAAQMLAVAALIVEPRWLDPSWTLGGQKITWYLVMIMLVLTVVSAVDYFYHAWVGPRAGEASVAAPLAGMRGEEPSSFDRGRLP